MITLKEEQKTQSTVGKSSGASMSIISTSKQIFHAHLTYCHEQNREGKRSDMEREPPPALGRYEEQEGDRERREGGK